MSKLKTTHTYTLLELSQPAFDEIKKKLEEAGYHHALIPQDDGELHIDMHGIAVAAEPVDG